MPTRASAISSVLSWHVSTGVAAFRGAVDGYTPAFFFTWPAHALDDMWAQPARSCVHHMPRLRAPSLLLMYRKLDPTARHEARFFGPAQTRHGPIFIVPEPARPDTSGHAWAVTLARWAARPGTNSRRRPEKARYLHLHHLDSWPIHE